MDDTACREFFTRPLNPYHRRYEALRAVFLGGHAPKDVAEQFGLTLRSLQQLIYEFRQHCRHAADGSPFFASGEMAALPGRPPRCTLPRRRSPPSLIVGNSSCPLPNRCA
jgi:hypothetical protein